MNPAESRLSPKGPYTVLEQLLQLRFAAKDFSLFARKPATSALAGNVRTRFRGRGVDFEEVRLYQPGDDIRSIDWRVTARTQIPHTKLYSEERERPVYVVCDQRASLFFGSVNTFKSTLAAHLSATFAWSALAGGDRIGGLVFDDTGFHDVRAKRSKHAVLQLLQQIDDFNHRLTSPQAAASSQNLAQILKDVRRIAKPGSAVFFVSDFYDLDTAAEEQLFLLARHLDITLIAVSDPLEQSLSGRGLLAVSDGQNRQRLNLSDRQFQRDYAAIDATRRETRKLTAKRLKIELLEFSTASDPLIQLRERYGARNRKRR